MKESPSRFWICLLAAAACGAATESPVAADPIIAFSRDAGKSETVYTVSASGGKARLICKGADPAISPDGRFLVYTATSVSEPFGGKKRAGAPASSGPGFARSLRIRELATGVERVLPTGGASQVYGAQWSPNGEWIAFDVLTKPWQVGVIKPDGSGFKVLTTAPDSHSAGWYLAGWDLQKNQILAQDLSQMMELTPSGAVTWTRPLEKVLFSKDVSSDLRVTISPDGAVLAASLPSEDDEIKDLDGPLNYLALVDVAAGKAQRMTPRGMDASSATLDPTGQFVLFRGFSARDVTREKHSDAVRVKAGIYRFDLGPKRLTRLIEDGGAPSVSR